MCGVVAVIGKQKDDGTIASLTQEDIETCNQFKFTYLIPEKIANKKEEKETTDDIIETLDEIMDSEEEDFEEFYESE